MTRFLKLEYAPTVVLVLALAQMASFASVGSFGASYAVAGLFAIVSLASGVVIWFYLKEKDVTAARIAIATGILFFLMLFGIGEYLFVTYIPT